MGVHRFFYVRKVVTWWCIKREKIYYIVACSKLVFFGLWRVVTAMRLNAAGLLEGYHYPI